MSARYSPRLLALVTICIGLAAPLLAAELVLRILPTNEGLRAAAVDERHPVFHFEPDRTWVWSAEWDFRTVSHVHVNNFGFVNDQNYTTDHATPLLAIVGDSYIEAAITGYKNAVTGRLAGAVGPAGRVYSFAASGAGLSQYLVWVDYARREFHPDVVVVSVVANDFQDSLTPSPGFHYFVPAEDGTLRLQRVDYAPSFLRRTARNSALAMYLMTNVKVGSLVTLTRVLDSGPQTYVGNVPYRTEGTFRQQARGVIDAFVAKLPSSAGVSPQRIVLTLDGFRPDMYSDAGSKGLEDSDWGVLRAYLRDRAAAAGIEVIDLHPIFMARYARDGRRFEYPFDGHWNSEGHAVVAEAIAASRAFRSTFGPQ